MKYLLVLLVMVYAAPVSGQQIDVRVMTTPENHEVNEFPLTGASIQYQGDLLRVFRTDTAEAFAGAAAFDRSQNRAYVSVIYLDGRLQAGVVDGVGKLIQNTVLDHFDIDDPTMDIRVFNDGRYVTQDNVANFTFFDTDGSSLFQISNSSQSPDGETASQLAADPAGRTVVLYNPRINYGSEAGSRARIVLNEGRITDLITSRDRMINHVAVTDNGSYVILITEKEGADEQVLLFDRFGNRLAELVPEMDLTGASVSEDGEYITIWSGNRGQAYRTRDLERLGSATFQARVVYARYIHDDRQLVALCGTTDNNRHLTGTMLYSVHLGERQIVNTGVDLPLSFLRSDRIGIDRAGANRYLIRGLNRDMEVVTGF